MALMNILGEEEVSLCSKKYAWVDAHVDTARNGACKQSKSALSSHENGLDKSHLYLRFPP